MLEDNSGLSIAERKRPKGEIKFKTTLTEEQFYNNVEKLSKLYFAMSVEDSAVIETILNKY